ncbi:copper chaperone PCu(A)C [Luteimonas vadosa]|uniref:Copper chaperone PCu(A)C n=1 Tax=Luteimonas vadosa TaxID=1165507 RepID=A0ABP9DXY7_9GAMM
MNPRTLPQLAFLVAIALAGALAAVQVQAAGRDCVPAVRDAWVRLPPVPMPMLAGFGRIENACAASVVIVGVRSAAFGGVELHESSVADGISRMRAVPRLRLAPRTTRRMQPGGLHLMLLRPRTMPAVGDTIAVDFDLSDGRTLRGEFVVRGADGR